MFNYCLFLDDFRSPACLKDTRSWETVRSYKEFVDKITKDGLPAAISFDHDLADKQYPATAEEMFKPIDYNDPKWSEKTGYHCALWLTEYCEEKGLPLPKWQVHSMNPVGRANIAQLLYQYERRTNSEG